MVLQQGTSSNVFSCEPMLLLSESKETSVMLLRKLSANAFPPFGLSLFFWRFKEVSMGFYKVHSHALFLLIQVYHR